MEWNIYQIQTIWGATYKYSILFIKNIKWIRKVCIYGWFMTPEFISEILCHNWNNGAIRVHRRKVLSMYKCIYDRNASAHHLLSGLLGRGFGYVVSQGRMWTLKHAMHTSRNSVKSMVVKDVQNVTKDSKNLSCAVDLKSGIHLSCHSFRLISITFILYFYYYLLGTETFITEIDSS